MLYLVRETEVFGWAKDEEHGESEYFFVDERDYEYAYQYLDGKLFRWEIPTDPDGNIEEAEKEGITIEELVGNYAVEYIEAHDGYSGKGRTYSVIKEFTKEEEELITKLRKDYSDGDIYQIFRIFGNDKEVISVLEERAITKTMGLI